MPRYLNSDCLLHCVWFVQSSLWLLDFVFGSVSYLAPGVDAAVDSGRGGTVECAACSPARAMVLGAGLPLWDLGPFLLPENSFVSRAGRKAEVWPGRGLFPCSVGTPVCLALPCPHLMAGAL